MHAPACNLPAFLLRQSSHPALHECKHVSEVAISASGRPFRPEEKSERSPRRPCEPHLMHRAAISPFHVNALTASALLRPLTALSTRSPASASRTFACEVRICAAFVIQPCWTSAPRQRLMPSSKIGWLSCLHAHQPELSPWQASHTLLVSKHNPHNQTHTRSCHTALTATTSMQSLCVNI